MIYQTVAKMGRFAPQFRAATKEEAIKLMRAFESLMAWQAKQQCQLELIGQTIDPIDNGINYADQYDDDRTAVINKTTPYISKANEAKVKQAASAWSINV